GQYTTQHCDNYSQYRNRSVLSSEEVQYEVSDHLTAASHIQTSSQCTHCTDYDKYVPWKICVSFFHTDTSSSDYDSSTNHTNQTNVQIKIGRASCKDRV